MAAHPKPKAPEQLARRFVCLRGAAAAFQRLCTSPPGGEARLAQTGVLRGGNTPQRPQARAERTSVLPVRVLGAVLGADVGSPGADVAAPGAAEQTTGDAHTRAAVMPSASASASALASSIGTDSSTGQTCRRAPAPREYRAYP